MQSPQDPEASVTVKEAASRIGYSIRQTDRFIQNGILKATHVNKSLRTVTVVNAIIRVALPRIWGTLLAW